MKRSNWYLLIANGQCSIMLVCAKGFEYLDLFQRLVDDNYLWNSFLFFIWFKQTITHRISIGFVMYTRMIAFHTLPLFTLYMIQFVKNAHCLNWIYFHSCSINRVVFKWNGMELVPVVWSKIFQALRLK